MEYKLDNMLGIAALDLYYEAHLAGIEGENFFYGVYFENGLTEEKLAEVKKAVGAFIAPYAEKDIYLGYIDVSKESDDKASVYLDLGNTEAEYQDEAIKGILKALNNVGGIKSVIINEDSAFDF